MSTTGARQYAKLYPFPPPIVETKPLRCSAGCNRQEQTMRILLFAAVAAATGAGGMTVMQTMVPGNGSMMQAVRALGGDPSKFKISDISINPVQAYRDVMKKVTSGDT